MNQAISLVTVAEVEAYFDSYKRAVKAVEAKEDWAELFANTMLRPRLPLQPNLTFIALQMHLFRVPAEHAETDLTPP